MGSVRLGEIEGLKAQMNLRASLASVGAHSSFCSLMSPILTSLYYYCTVTHHTSHIKPFTMTQHIRSFILLRKCTFYANIQ